MYVYFFLHSVHADNLNNKSERNRNSLLNHVLLFRLLFLFHVTWCYCEALWTKTRWNTLETSFIIIIIILQAIHLLHMHAHTHTQTDSYTHTQKCSITIRSNKISCSFPVMILNAACPSVLQHKQSRVSGASDKHLLPPAVNFLPTKKLKWK